MQEGSFWIVGEADRFAVYSALAHMGYPYSHCADFYLKKWIEKRGMFWNW